MEKIELLDRLSHLGLAHGKAEWRDLAWKKLFSKEIGLRQKENPFREIESYSSKSNEKLILAHHDEKRSFAPTFSSNNGPALYFLNGVFCKNQEKIPAPVILLPLSLAFEQFGALLYQRLNSEKNPFSLLNLALFEEGAFLYIPPHTEVSIPISLFFLYSASNESGFPLLFPRLHVFVGRNSKVHLRHFEEERGENLFFRNSAMVIHLDEGAALDLSLFSHLGSTSHHLSQISVTASAKSTFRAKVIGKGARSYRMRIDVALIGAGADANISGAFPLVGSQQQALSIAVDHRSGNTSSLQQIRGALKDESHFRFEGKIGIAKGADESAAYQISRFLLLSEHARATSEPCLEILADEVKATHGSTLGQIGEEELFYLKTRGLTDESARELLTLGFLKEIIDLFPEDERAIAYELTK